MRDVPETVGPRRAGFTLIELMVVVAILAVMLTVTLPAVKSLLQVGQLAQADNMVRATLISARTYALRNRVVAGVRFQEDGHMVQVYARNFAQLYNPDNYLNPPTYDLKAVEGVEPARMPDPYRVTVRDFGKWEYIDLAVNSWMSEPRWLDRANSWFVYPVVLFSSRGRVILGDCIFRSNPPWYPAQNGTSLTSADGAFANVTDITYTFQGGSNGDYVVLTSPTCSSYLQIFNYTEFRGKQDIRGAVYGLASSASPILLDVNTGMIVRQRSNMVTGSN